VAERVGFNPQTSTKAFIYVTSIRSIIRQCPEIIIDIPQNMLDKMMDICLRIPVG